MHAREVIGGDHVVVKDRQEEDSSVECHVFLLDWAVRDRRMKSDGRRKREAEEE